MFVESLGRLNERLKMANSTVTVVAFMIMPANTHSFTVETLKGQAVTKQLRETVTDIQSRIGKRLFEAAARGTSADDASKMNEEEKVLFEASNFSAQTSHAATDRHTQHGR